MRHLHRDGHGEFYIAGKLAVFEPGSLVYQFLHAILLDGVGVYIVILQHLRQFSAGWLGVAIQEVVADDLLAVAEHIHRHLVHFQNLAIFVAHRHGIGGFVKIFEHWYQIFVSNIRMHKSNKKVRMKIILP